MTTKGKILVAGATGMQGGATIDALLMRGFPVRALVRDVRSAGPSALARRGVELAIGDFEDEASLAAAMEGIDGVFSMQMPPAPGDLDSEIRTGRNLVEAARSAKVAVFVHTSVARAGDQANFAGWAEGRWWKDYWNSKSAVNDLVRRAGFPHWLILKPAFMMENLIPPKAAWMFPTLGQGVLSTAMAKGAKLDFVSATDVGLFAAAAFADPNRFGGLEIDLAAEALSMDDVSEVIARVTGKVVTASHMTPDAAIAAGLHPGLVENQQWASVEGYRVNIEKARSYGLPLESFSNWAKRHEADFAIA